MNKGLLIVVSGPSGCGKGTVLNEVLGADPNLFYSISATTRAPRPGETDGVNYYFMSIEEFEKQIASGGMLEYARYVNNYYGTPLSPVESHRNAGNDVILEIEVQGAMQIKEKCPDAIFVFIAPPSMEELERRLNKRSTESAETIRKRLATAEHELTFADQYDYIVTNDDLPDAVNDFKSIIRAEKCKVRK